MKHPDKTSRGVLIKTSKTQLKFSRRAILKRLGIGAGFLPLLSTERARAAANGFPTRFIAITWTDGVCPPNFYPSGSAGAFSANLPSILSQLQPWSSKLIAFRHATKIQSPFDINVMEVTQIGFTGKSGARMSSYTSLGVGAIFYQNPPSPFTIWFDDLAIDDSQIGCQ